MPRRRQTWQSPSECRSLTRRFTLLNRYHRYPILFYKPSTSIIGPEAPITIPKALQPVEKHVPDYEVELTVVIGKAAKNVSEANALDHVLAYTAGNDVCLIARFCVTAFTHYTCKTSFRYHQLAVSQWGFSKGYGTITLPAHNLSTN